MWRVTMSLVAGWQGTSGLVPADDFEAVFRAPSPPAGPTHQEIRNTPAPGPAQVATLTKNMARLRHKTVGAALRYQHSQDGRDAIVAASLSANALAELAATSEHSDTEALADAQ
jgi:hypothetical protein